MIMLHKVGARLPKEAKTPYVLKESVITCLFGFWFEKIDILYSEGIPHDQTGGFIKQ